MPDANNGVNRPATRPVLHSTSPRPTAVSRDRDERSDQTARSGITLPGLRRQGRAVIQPPVAARTAPRRKPTDDVPLHPALMRKLLSEQSNVAAIPEGDRTRRPVPPIAAGDATGNATYNQVPPSGFVRVHSVAPLHSTATALIPVPEAELAIPPAAPVASCETATHTMALAITPAGTGSVGSMSEMVDITGKSATGTLSGPAQGQKTRRPAFVRVAATRAMARLVAEIHEASKVLAGRDTNVIAVSALSFVIGAVAVLVSLRQNLILQYPDARSHLEIARRVFDNRTPGLVQLGTVWLPVPHLLLLPFVNIDILWATGLAGSIVGIACFVVTCTTLFLAVRLVTGRVMPAWLAVGVLLTNPPLLYIQSTALTEPVLLASVTASAYFLLRWTRDNQTKTLLAAGVFAALAVGSRYDGWFFALASTFAIACTVLTGRRRLEEMQGIALAYATIPLYTMALWFLYNWIYFGDPLEFQRGAFSAQQQQKAFEVLGVLSTKGNMLLSARTYLWTMYNNTGVVIAGLSVIGLIVYLVTTRFRSGSYLPYVFLAPIPFNILALWLGQTIIRVPQVSPGEFFNIRYGLLILPGMALFIAYLYHRMTAKRGNLVALPLFVAALAIQCMLWWSPDFPRQIPVVTEGVNGGIHDGYVIDAARFLHDSYHGGGILIDDSTTHITTLARIPMREYVGTYSGPVWRAALTDPAPVAKWIVVSKNTQDGVVDLLLKTSGENPYYFADYTRSYVNEGLTIYERKPQFDVQQP